MKVIYADSRFLLTKRERTFTLSFRRDARLYCLMVGPYDFVIRRGPRLDVPRPLARAMAELTLGAEK